VSRNDGAGRFSDAAEIALGVRGVVVDVVDLDSDRIPDLVVRGNDWSAVVPGDGSSGLAVDEQYFPLATGFEIRRVADLDRDGFPDLLTLTAGGTEFWVHRNVGGREFEAAGSAQVTSVAVPGDAADVDGGGDVDIADLETDGVHVVRNSSIPALTADLNANEVPDEREGRAFHRGDANGDGRLDVTDAMRIFGFLLQSAAPPPCPESADADNSGAVSLSDGISVLRHLFLRGLPPVVPGPPGRACAPDPDRRGGAGDLGCEDYAAC